MWTFHVLCGSLWVFSRYFNFLPQSKVRLVSGLKLIGYSKLAVGVNQCLSLCFRLAACHPVSAGIQLNMTNS